jgi:Tfp pilus assembly protein PilF
MARRGKPLPPVPREEPPGPVQTGAPAAHLREMGVDEFVRRLRRDDGADKRFAIFLGAGCSVTSGIPAASRLVTEYWLPRLRELRAPDRKDLMDWAAAEIPDFDPTNPAASYGELIDRLFVTAEDRQREIESLCDGRSPSFGYAVLAQLVAMPAGRFNVVVTTNFDDLMADALYVYTEARPLVIHHEALAAYIRPTRTRPLVVKLHGDHRLSPRNTALETEELEREIGRHTAMVLHDRGLIFMGYGGFDRGIHKLLSGLPRAALPYGVYWVHPQPPTGPIRDWLAVRAGIWVRSGWFDEVMLLIRNAFDLPHPDQKRFSRIFDDYQKKWQELSAAIDAKPETDQDARTLKAAVATTERSFPDYWKAASEALRLEKTSPDEAEQVYRRGIEQFPGGAPLLGNYALFLNAIRKDHDAAEAMYRRAIEADPRNAANLGNYAIFLKAVREDGDAAEAMYKRAIDADPKNANNLGNYALFLNVRGDGDTAEAMYKRAIDADPKNANNLGNYALFLNDVRGDSDAAETMYTRALEADPRNAVNLGNYANFLEGVHHDHDAAEAMYKRSIEADPGNAAHLGNYANFLTGVRKDHDAAEVLYKRSLEADARNAAHLSNYATFLTGVRKDPDAAEVLYKRAIEANPRNANNLANYAGFLLANGRPEGLAFLDRALAGAPSRATSLECWYYMFAHGPSDRQTRALRTLKRLLIEEGSRSPGWDLSANVARAVQDGHPESQWLAKLAAVVGVEADPSVLKAWPAWLSTGSADD